MKSLLVTLAFLCAAFGQIQGQQKKVVCYFGSWSVYRPGNGKFDVEQIDPFLCTHAIFGFAGLDPVTNQIVALDPWNELEENWGRGAYKRFNNLRSINPALKTIIAIGGWNEGSVKYSKMAANPASRRVFVDSVVAFLRKHKFDGLDMDWEYPANRGGVPEDKHNFVLLLKDLREEFDRHSEGWLLTCAVSAGKATIDTAYDVPGVSRYLHFINVMTYDFHGAWEKNTGHNSPLNARPGESDEHHLLTMNYSINYWIKNGAPREQLILGMALYGRSFTLADPSSFDSGAEVLGPGSAGPYTREPGTLGYNEICERIASWNVIQDPHYKAPYAYSYNQWVSFDDQESIRVKAEFAKSMGLGGGMVWSVETDDFRGWCHGVRFPLLEVINTVLHGGVLPPRPSTVQPPTDGPVVTGGPVITAPPNGECTKVGYHRDANDCTKFYYCQVINGKLTVVSRQTCPAGLVFDLVTLNCGWPDKVDCSN